MIDRLKIGRLSDFIHARSSSRNRLLACETDGFMLRAAIVQARAKQPVIEAVAESRAVDFTAAVAEVVAQFREDAVDVPVSALLLTPSLITAMLELPVKADKPRPDGEMRELIRWEMEPLFAQQIALWSIGAILVGRGHLTEGRRDELIAQARGTLNRGGSLFGELAIEQGFVTREQVEEALELQQHLQVMDQTLACGWAVPGDTGERAMQTGWLACAVGEPLRQRWTEAFAQSGIHLDWLYPLVGPAIAALPGEEGAQALLEMRQGMVACIRREGDAVTGLHLVQAGDDALSVGDCLEACHDLLRGDIRTPWLHGEWTRYPVLVEQLIERLGRELKPVPLAHEVQAAWSTAGVAGAAAHALGLQPRAMAVRLRGRPPGPPLYQRPQAWVAAAVAAALLGTGALEWSFLARAQSLEAERATYQEKLAAIESVSLRIKDEKQEAATTEQTLKTLEEELETVRLRRRFLAEVLPRRVEFVQSFLADLAATVSPEIVLDEITESETQAIQVRGWALSEKAAQQFARNLAAAMQPWSLTVEGLAVRSQPGRLGLTGYALSLQLAPVAKQAAGGAG